MPEPFAYGLLPIAHCLLADVASASSVCCQKGCGMRRFTYSFLFAVIYSSEHEGESVQIKSCRACVCRLLRFVQMQKHTICGMLPAAHRAGADSQPYGVGPLETCPHMGSPFAGPAMARGFSSDDVLTIPKSPPKQIVRFLLYFACCHKAWQLNLLSMRLATSFAGRSYWSFRLQCCHE